MTRGVLLVGLLVGPWGCGGATLEGDWSGEIECVDGSTSAVDIEVDAPDKELNYTGDYYFQAYNNIDIDGDIYRLESDWQGDLTVTQLEKEGEQDVVFALTVRAPNCRIFKNDNELSDECYYDGLEIGFTMPTEIEGKWDGLDAMELDSTACDGEVER